jgi:hypothetical protein
MSTATKRTKRQLRAHRLVESRESTGKVVLELR